LINKIDWISFSVKFNQRSKGDEDETIGNILYELTQLDSSLPALLGIGEGGERTTGRKPYSHSWLRDDNGLSIFYHPSLDHALIEITGRGCSLLDEQGNLYRVLAIVTNRLTRLDIACDMLTGTRPEIFANKRDMGRFKSMEHKKTQSGETFYVGSRKSNRFARVYRYEPPHDRCMFLRCEFETHAKDARNTAIALLGNGIESVVKALGEAFGWTHGDWQPDTIDRAELKAWRPERGKGKTLFWLNNTIAPLLAKLHQEGTLDVNEWIKNQVLRNPALEGEGLFDYLDSLTYTEIPF